MVQKATGGRGKLPKLGALVQVAEPFAHTRVSLDPIHKGNKSKLSPLEQWFSTFRILYLTLSKNLVWPRSHATGSLHAAISRQCWDKPRVRLVRLSSVHLPLNGCILCIWGWHWQDQQEKGVHAACNHSLRQSAGPVGSKGIRSQRATEFLDCSCLLSFSPSGCQAVAACLTSLCWTAARRITDSHDPRVLEPLDFTYPFSLLIGWLTIRGSWPQGHP